jgi:hypothetical protein
VQKIKLQIACAASAIAIAPDPIAAKASPKRHNSSRKMLRSIVITDYYSATRIYLIAAYLESPSLVAWIYF